METNNTKNIRKIRLNVGNTEIGKVRVLCEGEEHKFKVYYGNRLFPELHGEYLHCKSEIYKELLFEFLNTEEGSKYIWPTEEEIEIASQLVLLNESRLISKQEKETPKQNVQLEPIEVEQKSIQNPIDELELINLQKRVKVMFVLIIIQFVSIASLIALRVIKL